MAHADAHLVQVNQAYAKENGHSHVLALAGYADFSAHAQPQCLGGYLGQRLPGRPGHGALLMVGFSNHMLPFCSDHGAFHNLHHALHKLAAVVRRHPMNRGWRSC